MFEDRPMTSMSELTAKECREAGNAY
jgi:hypothetical protein